MGRFTDIPFEEMEPPDLTCVQCKGAAFGEWEEGYDDDHGSSPKAKADHTCDVCEEPLCQSCADRDALCDACAAELELSTNPRTEDVRANQQPLPLTPEPEL